MTTHTIERSPVRTARIAGILYLFVVPLGIFSLSTNARSIVNGDAAATASQIAASEFLFRLSIISDLLATLIMVLVALTLYRLFKPVNRDMAALMIVLVVIAAPIAILTKLNQVAALQILSSPNYLKMFTTEQLQALAYQFLRLHDIGSTIAFIFWGLWLFPLGYLVFRSRFLPRILGVLLMIASFGYPIDSVASLLGSTVSIGMVSALVELLFILWLLIKGVDVQQWKKHVVAW